MPVPIIPTPVLSTQDVLYGDRTTSYRWEVLSHSSGIDTLVGTLDGVSEASLSWTQNASVKGRGKIQVLDLEEAKPGMMRISKLPLESIRIRPVRTIVGLPEDPLGVFLVSNVGADWKNTGRLFSLELLDRCTVPYQDAVDESYSVAAGTLILPTVQVILASSGEHMAVDSSSTLATSSGMAWESGTTKLQIINDLLDVAGYNSLWMDGWGSFQATPRELPADRSVTYELLGLPRELRDGARSIYKTDWSLDRDSFQVPNKVIAIQASEGEDDGALRGVWTNTDPSSPYSYPARGNRWITHVVQSVECPEGSDIEILAFLDSRARATLVAMSAVQAQVKITHLPIPARVSNVLLFSNAKAEVDGLYIVTKTELDATPMGLMKSTLQEVISL